MSKEKRTPQERKRLSYKKDHRTRTGEDDRAWRKAWAHRKKRVNRAYRRKAGSLLRDAIRPNAIDEVLIENAKITREFIRKGLTREKNTRKWGVSSLGDLVKGQAERRSRPRETNRERDQRLAKQYVAWILAFERDADSPGGQLLLKGIRHGSGSLWAFCQKNPEWKKRLWQKLRQLQKEEKIAAEKAKLKAEQKCKWLKPQKADTE